MIRANSREFADPMLFSLSRVFARLFVAVLRSAQPMFPFRIQPKDDVWPFIPLHASWVLLHISGPTNLGQYPPNSDKPMGAKLALQNQCGRGCKRNDGMKRETVRHYERRSKTQGKTLQAVI